MRAPQQSPVDQSDDQQLSDVLDRLLEHKRRSRRHKGPGQSSRWWALIVLVAVGSWTIYLTFHPVALLKVWDLQDPRRVAVWLLSAGVRYAIHATAFLLLGAILPGLAVTARRRRLKRRSEADRADNPGVDGSTPESAKRMPETSSPPLPRHRWSRRLLAFVIAVLMHGTLAMLLLALTLGMAAAIVAAFTFSWGLQPSCDLAIALFGLLPGIWIGVWWRRGRRGRTLLAVHVAVVVACSVACGSWLYGQLLQSQPLGFTAVKVKSQDKRDLVHMVQRQSIAEENRRHYRVAPDDLNQLLSWCMTAGAIDGKAMVELGQARQQLQASVRVPLGSGQDTYLNIVAAGSCEILDEQLDLALNSLQVGAIRLPPSPAGWLSRFATRWVSGEWENAELLTGVLRASADQAGVEVVVSNDGLRRRRLASVLRQLGDHPDVTLRVRNQLITFAEMVRSSDRKQPLFDTVVRSAFERAAKRSRGTNTLLENRAAILALGIALGHINLDTYVGDCWDSDARVQVYRLPRQSSLRGRADWARHFWVSAAVTLIAGDRVSDAAGLLKEELDAGDGGSGFSFGDLMADRAGTEFARLATRDATSALAIQQWVLQDTTDLNDLMPAADDLPEGLTDAEMEARFDGVGGRRYLELKSEIERRLDAAPWQ